jgi:hypothetical protein
MDLVFKPPENHRFIHFLTGIHPFDEKMSKSIGDIDEAPPGMPPLKPSTKIEGLLGLFEYFKKNENGPVS